MLTNAIAMYLDQFFPPDPVQIGHYLDLLLFAEGQGSALPRVRAMLTGDAARYSDLCGRTVGLVMPLLDWRGRDLPFCITACHGDEVVAAAWAGAITSRETSAVGCNLSFGVRPDFAGRGLATILSAIAYQQCSTKEPMLEFVNVQTEAGNYSAQAVADRLLLSRAPSFDRTTAGAAPRLYVTYRAPGHVVAARCDKILASAGVDLHVFHRTRPNHSLKGVQPRFLPRPSIAVSPPPSKGSKMFHLPVPAAGASAMTAPDDESSKIGAINLPGTTSPVDALIQLLGNVIADTPEAGRAAERLVARLTQEFPRERIVLLSEDDRTHIISGMVSMRRNWEACSDGWISDVINYGYDGYGDSPDTELLEAAFCDNPILEHLDNDADRLGVLRVLARPEVLEIICSPERAQPVNDFEAFACHTVGAVGPMNGLGRTAQPEQVLEAMKLHGVILQQLAKRLGVEDDLEEGSDPTDAPRG